MNIETKWHRLRDAANAGRIRLAVHTQSGSLPLADEYLISFSEAEKLLVEASSLPRFVVEDDAVALLATNQAILSVSDMLTCGLLHLPYSRCLVEFRANDVSYSVLLSEDSLADGRTAWSASVFGYRGPSLKDDAALFFPGRICLSVEQPDEAPMDTDVGEPRFPEMSYSVEAERFMRDVPALKTLMEDCHPLAFNRGLTAFLAAVLLPRTIGLKQEARSVKASLNRSRYAKGKSEIPSYTLVGLASFVDANGSKKGLAGKENVSVHLRRAHKKRVAVGVGRSGREWRFLPAQVVGYLPDGRKPTFSEMLATRAAKPYILK